jgi:hypothetical protein
MKFQTSQRDYAVQEKSGSTDAGSSFGCIRYVQIHSCNSTCETSFELTGYEGADVETAHEEALNMQQREKR